ncbi:unnamed protein product [Microthlaspi erraticum]|uniref:Uncharacterized protein n=1 Tax=Microthlaspi erraticum TaxID=1685480 RepID=A0A6D2KUT1_9BRAS|nr:unnamed protein product [Microthlaspi erraticum]
MADGVKFGRSRASKMADNPNHGIYRGHRLKSPQSSLHIASKEENPDWNEQNWRRPKEDVPGANLKFFKGDLKPLVQTTPTHQSPYYTILVDEISR